jgi:hypothetical protein
MSNFAASFASLVKTRNGRFKSAAQAQFLMSQCVNNEYVAMGTVHGNGYSIFYTCDAEGVVKVQKQTVRRGLVTEWERAQAGQQSVQDLREVKRIQRLIKQAERSIAERQAAWLAGEYPNRALFDQAQDRDLAGLRKLEEMLAQVA